MKVLARTGYAAKGVVYLLVGGLAVQGVSSSGSQDALSKLANQPFGQVLTGLTAAGLLAYAAWRFVQGVADPENEGSDALSLGRRFAYLVSGALYVGLALTAARLMLGGSSGGDGAQSWTASVLQLSFGQWLVGAVALSIFVAGIHQFYQGVAAGFTEDFALGKMSDNEKTWATRAGRVGHVSRSVIYFIVGWLVLRAALSDNPSDVGGMDKALSTLRDQGPWLLGAAGLGLVCYGVYCFVMARYRKAVV